jgi:DNA-binding transcriptional regulator YdaS (Cro superfamily)
LTFITHVFILLGIMQALEKAYQVAGSQTTLARAIGVVPQVVNNWHRRGNVPAEYCPRIERATHGVVRCEELRPDVDWAYLRKTDCPA